MNEKCKRCYANSQIVYKMSDSAWTQKGESLCDKSARIEYGLFQAEIIDDIKSGKLKYRQNYIHGNPYFKLIRREVENFITEKYSEDYLKQKKLDHKFSLVNKEIKILKRQLKSLEDKKLELLKYR